MYVYIYIHVCIHKNIHTLCVVLVGSNCNMTIFVCIVNEAPNQDVTW